jgi:iron complex outermembrane recepter protein
MSKLKPIVAGVATAFGAAGLFFSLPAFAQQTQQPSTPQKIERIEITGSNIKRIDTETVAPIQVITRAQIERSGQATVAEVIRSVNVNTGGSFGESFSNSFAPGAAGVSLRGLGQKTTLVLLNGRRAAGYGFAQNLQDSFFDLNSIPSSAVERVEILKDGASALYGSDAIAGVINIILRKDYQGLEIGANIGTFEGKNDVRFTATGGFGDLGTDKYTAFAVFDYYKRDFLSLADTKFGESRDYRGRPGGRNQSSLTAGGTWRQLTPTGGLSNTFRASSECAGTVLTGPQALEAGLINTTTPVPGAPAGAYQSPAILAQQNAFAAATNTFCSKDLNSQFTALPGTERIGLLSRASYEFSQNILAYAELGLSSIETKQTFSAPFFAGTTGLTPTAVGLRPFTYNINFGPGVAGNPFPTNARYVGNLNDMGTRDNEIQSDTIRVLTGLKYAVGSWDLDSGINYSRNKVESFNTNRLSLAGTSAVFGVPTTAQPPVPTSTASVYNLDRPSTNSQAVRDQLRANFPRQATSTLASVDTKGSTELWQMGGGAAGLALGAEYRTEKVNDQPDPIAASGGVLGQGITATNASRNSTAIFAEIVLPFTKAIETQLALRSDRYSDYGQSTTPKVGFKFKPTDSVLIRANWGKGFRAPTLQEISPSVATFFQTVTDPEDGAIRQISGVFAGNPDLKAEKSVSKTLGIVLEPSRNISFGIDLYEIDWRDIVGSVSTQDVLDASCPNGGPGCPSTPNILRDPANNNQVVIVSSQFINLARTKTRGVDFDMKMNFATAYGKFIPSLNVTYVDSFKEQSTPDSEFIEYVGTSGGTNTIPRVKGSLTLDWEYEPFVVTGRLNYTRGWYPSNLPVSYTVPQDPRFQTGVYPTRTPSYTTGDLNIRYQWTKDLVITGAILNVLDKTPPYDPDASTTTFYDFSQFDVRGRQFRLGMTYKFK